MRFLELDAILRDMFSEELGRYGPIGAIHLLHSGHSDVYRVEARTASLIAHAGADAKPYLKRLRSNLDMLAPLNDPGIPRLVAWRSATAALPGRDWAVLVYPEMPGETLSRNTLSTPTWNRLIATLERVHGMDADPEPGPGPVVSGHHPLGFPAFARMLQLRLRDLPVDLGRVRAHLDQMSEFVASRIDEFSIPPRMIHGDLDRKNIVVEGGRTSVIDWADLGTGDYAFDLAMLKFMLDSVLPGRGAALIRDASRRYRDRFQDGSLETRLRYFVALAGLIHAFHATDDTGSFKPARAWRVRTSYLHSEAQWKTPLRLDGAAPGAPAVRTEQWALDIRQPFRGLFYLVAPKRVA